MSVKKTTSILTYLLVPDWKVDPFDAPLESMLRTVREQYRNHLLWALEEGRKPTFLLYLEMKDGVSDHE